MSDTTKLRIRRELAERMGYSVEIRWRHATNDNWAIYDLRLPGGIYAGSHSASEDEAWTLAPNPFFDHAACAALVEWLAGQGEAIHRKFVTCLMDALTGEGWHMVSRESGMSVHHIMKVLTSPLEARVLAACEALGISTGDE